ncbi:disks large-associated protein 5 [Patella vulgata]|uniref:disks large-associated protein 5 n=1 Tax=Patella vulgata TaxID=6465 RepID=UPI0024A8A543|nr:disks large-associated protein 5 [Patella vulgata]
MESNYSDAYKIKSVTVDKRLVRSQRRSIDWKNQRQQLQEKRRAIEDLSPLQEIFHNSALAPAKVTNDTPSRKPGKTLGLKNGKHPGEDRKSQLSKWKQEKEAKRKIEALEKARNMPFKVGKIEHKDDTLYTGFQQSSKRQPMEPARKPVESKPKDQTKHTNSLKRKGDELQASISKRSNLDSRTSKQPENKLKPSQRREVRRTVTKSRASPARRTTRQTTSGVNRLLAPTASTAAKKVDKTNGSAKVKTTEPQSKIKIQTLTNRKSKNQPTTSSSDVNVPDESLSKVTTVRGDVGFPDDFTFIAPSNLKSYIFNPLSPTSAADFLFPNQESSSYSFFNSSPQNGRCSTPRGETEDKDGKKSDDPKFSFTSHTQGTVVEIYCS